MPKHLQAEIERLKKDILSISTKAEENFQKSIRAVEERDERLAESVAESDIEIDHMEVEIEEECLKILALHQPVATDLRFVVSALKVNNDLERVGDLALNIAERAVFLARQERIEIPFELRGMAETTRAMLKGSIDALVNTDVKLASDVCAWDKKVDALHRETFARIGDAMRKRPELLESLIAFLSISRYLERIADHATNIAEDVIYMLDGEIVRHRGRAYVPESDGEGS
jgi:phosphate transport system protein